MLQKTFIIPGEINDLKTWGDGWEEWMILFLMMFILEI